MEINETGYLLDELFTRGENVNGSMVDIAVESSQPAQQIQKSLKPPKDGDGDGLIYDGTPQEQSAKKKDPRDNPNFREWFGDSKIVNADGSPMVVYHGTSAFENFKEFKDPRHGRNETSSIGNWFTNVPGVADNFSSIPSFEWGYYPGIKGDEAYEREGDGFVIGDAPNGETEVNLESTKARTIPVYLSIKNPKVYKAEGDLDPFEVMMNDRDRFVKYMDGTEGVSGHWKEGWAPYRDSWTDSNSFKQDLISQGYDGIVLDGTKYDRPDPKVKSTSMQFVAFSANQIKSATTNSGKYDAGSRDITKSIKQPKDGDGDGLIYDGTEMEQPTVMNKPDVKNMIGADELFKRSQYQAEALQQAMGYKTVVLGQKYVARVNSFLSKHPAGNVIAATLSIDGSMTQYDRNGFADRGMDAYKQALDGRFTRKELELAAKWFEKTYSNSNEIGHVNQNRWIPGAIRTAKVLEVERPDTRLISKLDLWAHEKFGSNADNFLNWFGDSKVVDDQGYPLVMHHGTNAEFEEFDADYQGATDDGYVGRGFYFAPSSEWASDYGGRVVSAYLSLQKPLVIPWSSSWGHDSIYDVRDELSKVPGLEFVRTNREIPKGYEVNERELEDGSWGYRPGGNNKRFSVYPDKSLYGTDKEIYGDDESTKLAAIVGFNDKMSDVGFTDVDAAGLFKQIGRKKIKEKLIASGYDGIITFDPDDKSIGEVVVFDPASIKSTNNSGKFDRKSANINKAVAVRDGDGDGFVDDGKPTERPVERSEKFAKWFEGSKIVDKNGKPLVVYHGTRSEINEFTDQPGPRDRGFYFTPQQDYASGYATIFQDDGAQKISMINGEVQLAREYANVMPVYLSIKNPKFVLTKPISPFGYFDRVQMALVKIEGYDGLVVGITEYEWETGTKSIEDADEIVAFDSKQVKSATTNSGEYEPSNPDIRKRLRIRAFLTKAGFNHNQPRDDAGRWVRNADILTAANDPIYADRLRERVTDPAQRQSLDRAIAEASVLVNDGPVPKIARIKSETADNDVPGYTLTAQKYVQRECLKEADKLEKQSMKEISFWNAMTEKFHAKTLTDADIKEISKFTSFRSLDDTERLAKLMEQKQFVEGWKYVNRIKLLKTGNAINFEGEKYIEHQLMVQRAIEAGLPVPDDVLNSYRNSDWVPKVDKTRIEIANSVHKTNLLVESMKIRLPQLKAKYEKALVEVEPIRQSVIELGKTAQPKLFDMDALRTEELKAFDEWELAKGTDSEEKEKSEFYQISQRNQQMEKTSKVEELRWQVKDLVKANGSVAVTVHASHSIDSDQQSDITEATKWFNGLLAENHKMHAYVAERIPENEASQRSNFVAGDKLEHVSVGIINLSAKAGAATVVHEIGHGIETGADAAMISKAFVIDRAGGSSAIHLGNGFDPSEVYLPDKLYSNYSGKWYQDQKSTEVISVGLEQLYANPFEFAEKAPEHFNYVVAFIRGLINNEDRFADVRKSWSLLKAGFSPLQPRDNSGRWVKDSAILAAAGDSQLADDLRSIVTDVEERKKLEMAIAEATVGIQAKLVDRQIDQDSEIRSKINRLMKDVPESKAEVIADSDVQEVLERLGWTEEDLASAIGAPDDSTIKAEIVDDSIEVHVYHEHIDSMIRLIRRANYKPIQKYRDDDLVIENEIFVVKKREGDHGPPKGFGADVFTRQVISAARLGVRNITCRASKSDQNVGYSVWPRLGYDGLIENLKSDVAKRVRQAFPEARTIMDVTRTVKGSEWWHEHGVGFEADFDLQENSPSFRRLSAYLIARDRISAGRKEWTTEIRKYRPDQLRDRNGRWVTEGNVRSAAKDPESAAKLLARLDDKDQKRVAERLREAGLSEAGLDKAKGSIDRYQLFPVERDAKGKVTGLDGKKPPAHVANMRIPPEWKDVQVNPSKRAVLVATGIDKKGRVQRVYSQSHSDKQSIAKFAKIRKLAKKIELISSKIEKDAKRGDQTAMAALVVQRMGLRPGSDTDTKAEKQAYGATTLQAEHVQVSDGEVRLVFTGKKGVGIDLRVEDKAVESILVAAKKRVKSGRMFQTTASKLNDYVDRVAGRQFNAKDFRTLVGTSLAKQLVDATVTPKSAKELKAAKNAIGDSVAKMLGNTRTIALQSYIDSSVFVKWENFPDA